MPSSTIKVPALYGGVSLQPPHLRYPHQVEDASNALFSVVDGFSKRPGTWYLRTLSNLGTSADVRLHRIIRDGGERYAVVYGKDTASVLRVVELGGLEATVRITDNALGYLNHNAPTADQLRLVSEVDATFIINTTVPLGTVQGLTYVVSGVFSDYAALTATIPAVGTYYRTLNDTPGHPAGYFRYDGGVGGVTTLASIRFSPITGAFLADPAGFWDNSGQGPWGFKIGFQRMLNPLSAGVWTNADKTLAQTGAFTDYVRNEGDSIYVVGGTDVVQGWYEIVSRDSDDQITLGASITGGTDNANTRAQGIGVEALVSYPRDNPTLADMEAIAAKIQGLLVAGGALGALCSWHNTGHAGGFGSPALLQGYFVITSPYGGDEATITPPTAPPGGVTNMATTGFPFDSALCVVTTGSGTVSGTPAWTSVPAPDTTSDIDATKMPVRMTRTAKSNGASPAVFDVDVVPWANRLSGDDDTNPLPAPWTRALPMTDLKVFQDRFVFAAGEFDVMSEAGNYYNFLIVDYLNLADSDRITVQLSSDEITVIDFLTAYQKALAMSTQAGRQFQLTFTDVLKPGSVAITPSTAYTTLSVRPKVMGPRLYFLASDGYATQVCEYGFDDSAVTGDAANVSAHVPGYIPATIRSLDVSQNNLSLFVLPTAGARMYAYRSFWAGDTKQQSAWSTYDFDAGYVIADMMIVEDYCYLLVRKDGLWVFERFSIPEEPASVPIETVQ